MEMVASLKFEEKPDYDKFRQVLRQGLKDNGYADDGILVFPCLKGTVAAAKSSPAKKRSAAAASTASTSPKKKEEVENEVEKRVKPIIKKSREPCSPKVTNQRLMILPTFRAICLLKIVFFFLYQSYTSSQCDTR